MKHKYQILFSTGEGTKPKKGVVNVVGKNDDDGSLRVRIILEDGQVIEGNAVEVDQ